MAKRPEPKGWAEDCVDGVKLMVLDSVRATLKEQLKGVMQERSLRPAELSKLATALLEPPKEVEAKEKVA